MVGLARPGKFGADVSHLNLHKTFCIPHGGGGPGRRPDRRPRPPRAVPAQPPAAAAGRTRDGRGCDLGGAVGLGVDPADQLGLRPADGRRRADRRHGRGDPGRQLRGPPSGRALTRCSTPARTGWSPTSASSTCAPSRAATGVTVDDVAKRLVDYGFHAPTMSFPVAGTLDGRADRVRGSRRARSLHRGDDRDQGRDRPRRLGGVARRGQPACATRPHTASSVLGEWDHPYSRELAAFPPGVDRASKYWPPVRRIDQAYGDRNLVCACPPIESYA